MLDDADENKVSEIVRFVQDGKYTTILNDGDNSAFIVEALREKLEEELERLKFAVSFRSTNLHEQPYFYGRQDELYEIGQCLDSYGYAILSGEPGIGKTEIALKYAHDYAKAYTTVIWVKFRISFEETLKDILRDDPHNSNFADKPNAYSITVSNLNHLGKNALVIIDGMNVDFTNITILDEMKKYHFRFIVTTRSRANGAIVVPYLPNVYCKKIRDRLKCEAYFNEGTQENLTCGYNPFLYAINCLHYKQIAEKSDPEFPFSRHDYLGHQRLRYVAWLNKLYAFKQMPDNDLHVLKLLSVFSTNPYSYRFIYSICPLCTLERIERLVNLGWLINLGKGTYEDNRYANAFSWWEYYSYQYLDGDCEFTNEVNNILNSYRINYIQGGYASQELYNYALLALKINADGQAWCHFRNDVASRVKNIDFNLSHLIRQHTDFALTYSVIDTKKEWSDYRDSLSDSFKEYCKYALLNDSESMLKKKELTMHNAAERLKHDLNLIKWLAEKYIHNIFLNQIGAFDYYQKIIMVVECYTSVSNLTEPSEGNIDKIGSFLDSVINIGSRRIEDNLIYKSISSFCDMHHIEKPDNEIVQEFIDLMPMVRMIKRITDLVGSIIMCKCPEAIDGLITQRFDDLNGYGHEKQPKYRIFFYDILASCYLLRNAPDNAEECLKKANSIDRRGISDSDNSFQSFMSIVQKQKIDVFRFYKSKANDKIANELLSFLEQLIGVFEFDDFLKTVASVILYNYAIFCSFGRVDENLMNSLFTNVNISVNKLLQAGIADETFSIIPVNDSQIQPGS